MKTQIDLQTLLGFGSATGLPLILKSVIALVHPDIYTLVCGQTWIDGGINAACRKDDVTEAVIFLVLAAGAIAYGVWTLRERLLNNPTPTNTIVVQDATTGQSTTIATSNPPGTIASPTPAASAPQNGPKP